MASSVVGYRPAAAVRKNRMSHQSATAGLTRTSLTNLHPWRMVVRMKTTLNISDSVMKELKQEAVRQGCTMSELVEAALRVLLHSRSRPIKLPPLPELDGGEAKVDVADRDALYEIMDQL